MTVTSKYMSLLSIYSEKCMSCFKVIIIATDMSLRLKWLGHSVRGTAPGTTHFFIFGTSHLGSIVPELPGSNEVSGLHVLRHLLLLYISLAHRYSVFLKTCMGHAGLCELKIQLLLWLAIQSHPPPHKRFYHIPF